MLSALSNPSPSWSLKMSLNSTLLQLYLRESQAEIETQPCPQDGKQVLGSMAVKREDVRKGQHLERSSKHFSENKTVSKVKSNQKSL